ncbi:hypothetical protein AWZ03_014684 [Drosophila navojoa]|uniref:Reverse transcriptase/retrotransposon-derived protein RNase H-like domain-containing protein n=1 Tax=Drosophila navojoa TaxID=7232 RepID=A0A484AR91_DRONA|nr:hypothetical protein AWZ03_014684 [Drosophila navojoa]
MTKLLKKGQSWIWSEEQEEALQKLKESLTTASILACPDFSAKFVLQTDASDHGYRFDVVTDLALKWLNSIESSTGRIARWALELQQYQFDIRYRRGSLNGNGAGAVEESRPHCCS